MNRRAFLSALSGGLLAAPLGAEAQQAGKVYRVGIVPPSPISERLHLWEAFRQGLRDLGYVEGENITLVFPAGEVRPERLSQLAAELVSLKVSSWRPRRRAFRPDRRALGCPPRVPGHAARRVP